MQPLGRSVEDIADGGVHSYEMVCTTIEISDQPARPRILIRSFFSRIGVLGPNPHSKKTRLWSNCSCSLPSSPKPSRVVCHVTAKIVISHFFVSFFRNFTAQFTILTCRAGQLNY